MYVCWELISSSVDISYWSLCDVDNENAVSSDDEATIASFPSGSTYFSNYNEVNININNLWNTITSSDFEYIHSPRTRSAAKDSREYNSGCELYIKFRRDREI